MRKIIKHTFCKRGDSCKLTGQLATIEETIQEMGRPESVDYQPEWYWARVNGVLHRFQKGDLI
jgi:hypothetical protein